MKGRHFFFTLSHLHKSKVYEVFFFYLSCPTSAWSMSTNTNPWLGLSSVMVLTIALMHYSYMTNSITLAISLHDTLKPLGIQIRFFANNVRDTKYEK